MFFFSLVTEMPYRQASLLSWYAVSALQYTPPCSNEIHVSFAVFKEPSFPDGIFFHSILFIGFSFLFFFIPFAYFHFPPACMALWPEREARVPPFCFSSLKNNISLTLYALTCAHKRLHVYIYFASSFTSLFLFAFFFFF